MNRQLWQRWTGSLYVRLVMAWFFIMFLAHLAYVAVAYTGINAHAGGRTRYHLAKDLALLVDLLETAAPARHPALLARMQRAEYQFEFGGAVQATRVPSDSEAAIARQLAAELGPGHAVTFAGGRFTDGAMHLQVVLRDASVLTVTLSKTKVSFDQWGFVSFVMQIGGMLVVTAFAARQATLPLARLTAGAEVLGSSMQCEPLQEDGPLEVARAAAAFNAMGRRIKDHLAERVHILAAISHDLQTPITRMRLRTDLLDDSQVKAKFEADLDQMQVLVEEGITYARSTDPVRESACLVDIEAMLDALAGDYADSGHRIGLHGVSGLMAPTWPHTLRRILVNLIDNAIKFAADVEIVRPESAPDQLCLAVRDRGPGIDQAHIDAVFTPFYRLESSRNRDTGGTGLGLAIARQLALGLGGTLVLANRSGGGLEATLTIPVPLMKH